MTAPQRKVSVVGWFVAPFGGDESRGAAGGSWAVLNVHASDQPLAPLAFLAFTLQKYWLLLLRGEVARDESVTVESSIIVVENVGTVETCTRYAMAPGLGCQ